MHFKFDITKRKIRTWINLMIDSKMVLVLKWKLFKRPTPLTNVPSRVYFRTPKSDHTNLISFIANTTMYKERKIKIVVKIDSLDLRNRSTYKIVSIEKFIPRE
jgi:hypothetical protein